MSARAVCDASAIVALSLDAGPDGRWVAERLAGAGLSAPSLVLFESSNIIRRHEIAGLVSADQAAQAHADLLDVAIEYWPYELLGSRVWELRLNLSCYDASYVAVAELTDGRSTAAGPRRAAALLAPAARCSRRPVLAGPAGVSAGLAQHESIVGSLLINSKGRNGPPNGRGQAAASTIRTAAHNDDGRRSGRGARGRRPGGAHRGPKSMPPKWFYDQEGGRLFDQLTRLPEYYPTRRER